MRSLAVAVAVACAAPIAAQAPVFRATVEAVRVDALVLDGDRPVGGLTAPDFEVLDSGVAQQIDAIGIEDEPLRVMLVLDTSSSVKGEPLDHLRAAAGGVVDLLARGDRAAVLTFWAEVHLAAPWTADPAPLRRALDLARGEGSTALHDAAYAALTLRDAEPGRSLILLFSDGEDTASWLSGEAVLDTARRTDAVVYAVATRPKGPVLTAGFRLDVTSGLQQTMPNVTTPMLMERFLPALAKETGGKYLDVEATSRLREAFVEILREFRTRYVITYTPRGVDAAGWHPLDVRLTRKAGKVTARRGYLR